MRCQDGADANVPVRVPLIDLLSLQKKSQMYAEQSTVNRSYLI